MDRVDRLRGAPADVSFPARAEYGEEYVILIDNGDTFQGTPVSEVHLLRGNHPEGEPEAMALWREMKLAKGSSANQVKPVRVLAVPMKQKFFFSLIEEGQEVPHWDFYKKTGSK